MLILLPPSEGKTSPGGRTPVVLDSLVFADQLGGPRKTLLDSLEKLCRGPVDRAVETLAISKGQADEVAIDAELLTAPAGPASSVYTGVLYDCLGYDELSTKARRRAGRNLLIASGLWGMLRPGDRIPRYRFSMAPRLKGIGGLAAFWRAPLAEAMTAGGFDREGELVLDMRSGAYAAAWRPKHARLLAVRGFTDTATGRKAISHMAKAIRGDVARIVLEADTMPTDAEAAAGLVEAAGLSVELGPKSLDVIVPSL